MICSKYKTGYSVYKGNYSAEKWLFNLKKAKKDSPKPIHWEVLGGISGLPFDRFT